MLLLLRRSWRSYIGHGTQAQTDEFSGLGQEINGGPKTLDALSQASLDLWVLQQNGSHMQGAWRGFGVSQREDRLRRRLGWQASFCFESRELGCARNIPAAHLLRLATAEQLLSELWGLHPDLPIEARKPPVRHECHCKHVLRSFQSPDHHTNSCDSAV